MSFNQVILTGNLTRDPELKYTPKGTAVCQFGLAVNRKWKDQSGAAKEEVTFLDVESWGKSAETIGQHFRKGSPIFVCGRLKMDSWEDRQTNQKRTKLKIVCETFQFMGGAKTQPGEQKHRTTTPAAQQTALPTTEEMEAGQEDGVPF